MVERIYKTSEETRKKMSETQKRIGNIPPNHKGKKRSSETIERMRLSKLGEKNGMYGKKASIETRKKMSDSLRGKKIGKDNPSWNGGTSYFPYSNDWTSTLKRSIRERDNYVCFTCKALQSDTAFDVHHIDYDKQNCNPKNLITLCRKCHMRTNGNRNYWINFFKQIYG